MKYTMTQTLGGVTNPAMAYMNVSANNLHQPTIASINQPLGYDEWAQFYERYQVIGSKIRVNCMGSTYTGANGMMCYLVKLRNVGGALTGDIDTQMQQPSSYYKVGRDAGSPIASGDQGAGPVTLYHKFSAKKWFNLKDVNDNIATAGNFGGPPEGLAYYTIIVAPMDSLGASIDCIVHVMVEYIVLLSVPKVIAASHV